MSESGGIKNMALPFGAKAMLKTEEDTAEGLPEENAKARQGKARQGKAREAS